MPWVRFDDAFPMNRKVDGLSDTAFRLHVSAIFWCARNLTDGAVPEEDLELVTARVRAPARFATELVRRGLWHLAGTQCDSEHCPPSGVDGWVIHDYWEYQPSKAKVLVDRQGSAERQRKWRESHKGTTVDGNAVTFGSNPDKGTGYNGRSNGVTNAGTNAAPSRPVPSLSGGSSTGVTHDRAPASTTRPPDKCREHRDDPDPPACRRCKTAREAVEAWDAAYAVSNAMAEAHGRDNRPQCRRHRGQLADNCAMCRSEALAASD